MKAVDLFAGAGGFSTGAVKAGAQVVWAANHWPVAVEIHKANHPGAKHICQDLHQADWSQVPAHDLLLASPACQGHSKARGKDRPHHDATRSTAWAVVSAAEYHRPKYFVVENVPDFKDWILFDSWRDAMSRLGYQMTENVLNAADFGVPQKRERLFIVGSLGKPVSIQNPGRSHVPAGEIIDWNAKNWNRIDSKKRAARTLTVIENGRRRFGSKFIVPYYSSNQHACPVDRPFWTITTRERFAIVDGDYMRMMNIDEVVRAMSFPDDYQLTGHKKTDHFLLGNAVCPEVAADIIRQLKGVA